MLHCYAHVLSLMSHRSTCHTWFSRKSQEYFYPNDICFMFDCCLILFLTSVRHVGAVFDPLLFYPSPRRRWELSHFWFFHSSWNIFNHLPQINYTMKHAYKVSVAVSTQICTSQISVEWFQRFQSLLGAHRNKSKTYFRSMSSVTFQTLFPSTPALLFPSFSHFLATLLIYSQHLPLHLPEWDIWGEDGHFVNISMCKYRCNG